MLRFLPVGKKPISWPGRSLHPGAGALIARWHSRFSKNGKPNYHYMGTSTSRNTTVVPEIAVAKDQQAGTAGGRCACVAAGG